MHQVGVIRSQIADIEDFVFNSLGMIVSIHQPEFIGYLGYYSKIAQADTHIVLDDVQLIKRGFIQRNQVKSGENARWINVPIQTKGKYTQSINEVCVDHDQHWQKSLLGILTEAYKSSPYFGQYYTPFSEIINRRWDKIADLNLAIMKYMFSVLSIDTVIVRSSEYKCEGVKSERLAKLVKAVGGEVYLSGQGAKVYNDEDVFKECGVALKYSGFIHPTYAQAGSSFTANMCVLDLLFNCGEEAVKVLASAHA